MTLPHMTPVYEKYAPVVARVLLGLYFFHAAFFKIPGSDMFGMVVESAKAAGVPLATVAVFLAFLLEFLGGLALVLGFYTRTAAALFAGFMVLIALFFFRNFADQMVLSNFINCIGVAAGLIYVSVYGAQSVALKRCPRPIAD